MVASSGFNVHVKVKTYNQRTIGTTKLLSFVFNYLGHLLFFTVDALFKYVICATSCEHSFLSITGIIVLQGRQRRESAGTLAQSDQRVCRLLLIRLKFHLYPLLRNSEFLEVGLSPVWYEPSDRNRFSQDWSDHIQISTKCGPVDSK